ncbi:LOW QUALITY PROTEIN: hypothetical protein CVT26_006157 [Gymnopilus dilepis]|uniref:Uncharacterized protein n=1 Tax=Gymnopilus dilepis TaxID=231916 RepID=A0A409X4K2_9AGAR|nr:LOW QUALITY PROTEIN: hypothetical protein CVT26_006157 [Gymnopilus dilepis]
MLRPLTSVAFIPPPPLVLLVSPPLPPLLEPKPLPLASTFTRGRQLDLPHPRRRLLLPPLQQHVALPSHTLLPPSTLVCMPASPPRADHHEAQVVTWPPRLLHAAFLVLVRGANAPRRTDLGCHCHLAHTLSTAHHHLVVVLLISPLSPANLTHTFSNSALPSTGVPIIVSGGKMG